MPHKKTGIAPVRVYRRSLFEELSGNPIRVDDDMALSKYVDVNDARVCDVVRDDEDGR